jgi:broad specificity phosphatase PhoE
MRHAEVISMFRYLILLGSSQSLLNRSKIADSAQALHKLYDKTDMTVRDPDISPHGKLQYHHFAQVFKDQEHYIIDILSSPMTRALSTACIASGQIIDPPLTVIALPKLQNFNNGPNRVSLHTHGLAKLCNKADRREKIRESYEYQFMLRVSILINKMLKIQENRVPKNISRD